MIYGLCCLNETKEKPFKCMDSRGRDIFYSRIISLLRDLILSWVTKASLYYLCKIIFYVVMNICMVLFGAFPHLLLEACGYPSSISCYFENFIKIQFCNKVNYSKNNHKFFLVAVSLLTIFLFIQHFYQ